MLPIKLFNSFWNRTQWEKIFPSDPETARSLMTGRSKIVDILMGCQTSRRLDSIAADISAAIDIKPECGLIFTSFIDFYLFTWLKHFGILSYSGQSAYSPVKIKITDAGIDYLQAVRSQ